MFIFWSNLYNRLFNGCLSIHFFYSPAFFNTGNLWLPLTVQDQCYLHDARPFQGSPDASHLTLLGEWRISLGVAVILSNVPMLTYLAWLQPIINNLILIFNHVKTRNILLVVKSLIKKFKVVATLISSHELTSYSNYCLKKCILKLFQTSLQNCSLKKCISKLLFQ